MHTWPAPLYSNLKTLSFRVPHASSWVTRGVSTTLGDQMLGRQAGPASDALWQALLLSMQTQAVLTVLQQHCDVLTLRNVTALCWPETLSPSL